MRNYLGKLTRWKSYSIFFVSSALVIVCLGLLVFACTSTRQEEKQLTEWVNPFLGTAPLTDPSHIGYTPPDDWRVWAGLTYPGAALPNAMVQLSPVTEFHTGTGYQYEDSVIKAFTHTNKGHWNLCHIPVLPATGKVTPENLGSRFSHDSESASPGYYQVELLDYGINAEFTTTLRTGLHRYTFQEGDDKKIVFDLSRSNERIRDWQIEQVGDSAIAGYQDTGQDVYFYATLSQPIEEFRAGSKDGSPLSVITLASNSGNTVEMKIGLSFVSQENAKSNLDAEVANRGFEEVKTAARQKWEELLRHIEVTDGTDREKELFYSSLYRSFLWPALRSDASGEYLDIEGNIVQADFNYYTRPALWDTYRNKLVLLGMISPEVTTDVIKSLIDKGEKTGFIPTFFHGDHAAPFIAGSYLRGLDDFDVQKAYELLIRNATIEGGTRPHIKEYMEKGYISTPQVDDPWVETDAKAAVTKTLEYAYDDYAIAQLAQQLNDSSNYNRFMDRSRNYRNMFDASTGFMRGRLESGEWVKNFNPQYPYYEYMYREANAWQSTFFAPHDMEGLIDLFGSKERFESKLDSVYTVPWNPEHIARNVCCFIGQYAQGNQPDHHYPYLYYFIDCQPKTQKLLNRIMSDFYGTGMNGLALSGMDDAGEMSAWYVFNAMGFYPFSPADDHYLVSVPLFDEVSLTVGGNTLRIQKENDGVKIKEILLDGKSIEDWKLPHSALKSGMNLEIRTE